MAMDLRSSFDRPDLDNQSLLDHTVTKSDRTLRRKHLWFLALNACLLLLNIAMILMAIGYRVPQILRETAHIRLPHSDWVAPAMQYELRTFEDKFHNHGVYRGIPRPELDEAWAVPVRSASPTADGKAKFTDEHPDYTVRIPKPGWAMPTSPNRIITEFEDEKGGIMGVFSFLHDVHCLKTIRQYMLPTYYPETAALYPTSTEFPINEHIDHCIDMLRQTLMCHADMSLTTFEWHEEEERPVDIHRPPHVCVKSDALETFLEQYTVPPLGNILIHPWTGDSPY